MTAEAALIKRGRKFDQVLKGAREVFLRDGFEGASVDDIARAAGVSKATLYAYVPDKRLLFTEVARAECRRQAEEALARIDAGAPPAQVLPLAGRHILGFMTSEIGQRLFRICVAESERFPSIGQEFYDSGPKLVHDLVADYLEKARARGELRIDNVDLAAHQFVELCKAGVHVRLTFGVDPEVGPAEADHIIAGAVRVFLAAYGTPA